MFAITNTVLATINHISLPQQLQIDEIKAFDQAASGWHGLPVQVHVLDFKSVQKLHRSFYPLAIKFKKDSEARKIKVISINLTNEILEQLKRDGMEQALGYMKNLQFNDRPASKDSLEDIRTWLIKYSVEAGRAAMNIMFNTTVAADENYRETPKDFRPEDFFKVAVIRGDNSRFKAVFRLFFEKRTLEALSKTVADATNTSADNELLLSTATELLNIIYTTVKSRGNDERGYDLPPALPSLVDSTQFKREKAGSGASWIPFVTPLGAYYLQIELGA